MASLARVPSALARCRGRFGPEVTLRAVLLESTPDRKPPGGGKDESNQLLHDTAPFDRSESRPGVDAARRGGTAATRTAHHTGNSSYLRAAGWDPQSTRSQPEGTRRVSQRPSLPLQRGRHLGVPALHRAVARIGMQRKTAVPLQVVGLHCTRHGAEDQIQSPKADLCAADSRRSVAPQGGQHMVLRPLEASAHRGGQHTGLSLELFP